MCHRITTLHHSVKGTRWFLHSYSHWLALSLPSRAVVRGLWSLNCYINNLKKHSHVRFGRNRGFLVMRAPCNASSCLDSFLPPPRTRHLAWFHWEAMLERGPALVVRGTEPGCKGRCHCPCTRVWTEDSTQERFLLFSIGTSFSLL